MKKIICLIFSTIVFLDVNAASYEVSFVKEVAVVGEDTDRLEKYKVFKDLIDRKKYYYSVSGLKLKASGQGSPISMAIGNSVLDDDLLTTNFTMSLGPNTSPLGLKNLQKEINSISGVQGVKIAPLGLTNFKLYAYVLLPSHISTEPLVQLIDQGTITPNSNLAANLKIDAIASDVLKNIMTGEEGKIVLLMVQSFDIVVKVSQQGLPESSPQVIEDLFNHENNLPILPVYIHEIASADINDVEAKLNSLKSIAGKVFRGTPIYDADTDSFLWKFNKKQISNLAKEVSITKVLKLTDVSKSSLELKPICKFYGNSIIDIDDIGGFCE